MYTNPVDVMNDRDTQTVMLGLEDCHMLIPAAIHGLLVAAAGERDSDGSE